MLKNHWIIFFTVFTYVFVSCASKADKVSQHVYSCPNSHWIESVAEQGIHTRFEVGIPENADSVLSESAFICIEGGNMFGDYDPNTITSMCLRCGQSISRPVQSYPDTTVIWKSEN